jgi:hypothetical protein
MMNGSLRPRPTAELSKPLQQKLNAYALAGSAAVGIGLLGLAQPAGAKIIYTPAHAKVVFPQPLPVDLNHDGIVDFYLVHVYDYSHSHHALSVCQFVGSGSHSPFCSSTNTNAIRAITSKGKDFGAMLRSGARIQPGDRFRSRVPMGGLCCWVGTDTQWYGPWVQGGKGIKNRYLGLKFKIKGRFHFGWARVTVTTSQKTFTATLTGYAYETIPGKGIVAGKTKGPDVNTVNAASLGHLAAGASAIPAWRVGQTAATIH